MYTSHKTGKVEFQVLSFEESVCVVSHEQRLLSSKQLLDVLLQNRRKKEKFRYKQGIKPIRIEPEVVGLTVPRFGKGMWWEGTSQRPFPFYQSRTSQSST